MTAEQLKPLLAIQAKPQSVNLLGGWELDENKLIKSILSIVNPLESQVAILEKVIEATVNSLRLMNDSVEQHTKTLVRMPS